jgi:hypothetical protein
LIGLVLVACTRPPMAEEWLTVTPDYPRYLHGQNRINLSTTNLGLADIYITSRLLRAEHFVPLPADNGRSSIVWAGRTVDIQVEFGEVASCGDRGPFAASVEYEYSTADDSSTRRVVIAFDPGLLDQIRETRCARQAILEAVDISPSHPVIEGTTVRVDLTLTRRQGRSPIRLAAVRGSVIFAMTGRPASEGDPIVELASDQESVTTPISFEVARCEPHAVSQASQPYVFTLWIGVAGRPAEPLPLVLDPDVRTALATILDRCLAQNEGQT